jgi:hypothetical protein
MGEEENRPLLQSKVHVEFRKKKKSPRDALLLLLP